MLTLCEGPLGAIATWGSWGLQGRWFTAFGVSRFRPRGSNCTCCHITSSLLFVTPSKSPSRPKKASTLIRQQQRFGLVVKSCVVKTKQRGFECPAGPRDSSFVPSCYLYRSPEGHGSKLFFDGPPYFLAEREKIRQVEILWAPQSATSSRPAGQGACKVEANESDYKRQR